MELSAPEATIMATAMPLISSRLIMATNRATPFCELLRFLNLFFIVFFLTDLGSAGAQVHATPPSVISLSARRGLMTGRSARYRHRGYYKALCRWPRNHPPAQMRAGQS